MDARRTRNSVTIEATKIVNDVTKAIFKNYKETPHREFTYEEAFENVSDMACVEELIRAILMRRDTTLT